MKYRYKLNNLDCPKCANKIECELNKNKNIKDAKINFSKLELIIDTDIKGNVKGFVSSIVNNIESDVTVLDIDEENNTYISLFFKIGRLLFGMIVSILGIFVFSGKLSSIFIILGYIILLSRVILGAFKMLLNGFSIDEKLLITISCIGAYFTDNIYEGLMVIILYEIGKILEFVAVNNSRSSITKLMDIKPEYANVKLGEGIVKVSPYEVNVGDIIVILEGDKVPLDGKVVSGKAKLNVQAITGESKLKEVNKDDMVLSGSINTLGILEVEVLSKYESSTVSKILSLTENATDRKTKLETIVTKISKIYTPIILVLAILVVVLFPILFKISFEDAIYRALVFLVISCPCAIAISVPLCYFSGIGAASKKGILVKGSDYLDSFNRIKEIIFDKTGTLTTGKFLDYKLELLDNKYDKDRAIKYMISGESLSNHPIAKSLLEIFKNVKIEKVNDFEEISGMGIKYRINKDIVKVGSSSFCNMSSFDKGIYVNINDNNVLRIELYDKVRSDAKETVRKLKSMGIRTKMFTGDDKEYAINISNKLGIDSTYYELLPQDKYKLLEDSLSNKDGLVAFIGDGINDVPSLARADIGISMGSIGSDSAIEASDIVIVNDELNKIIEMLEISRITNRIVKQNLIFAIGIKVLVLILSAVGISSMWEAVFADTGLTLLTILNTTRILKK